MFIKKIIGLLIGFSLLMIVGGCQQNGEEIIDEQPLDRRIGTIKSLGSVKTSNQGTHILELDSGDTVLLRSIIINLDDSKFRKNVVEVRGVLNYTKDGKQIMTVSNIDVLEAEVEEESDSSEWITYSSSRLGFSLTYRSDFDLDDEGSQVSFIKEFTPDEEDSDETIEHTFTVKRTLLTEDDLISYLGLDDDSASALLAKSMSKSKVGEQSLNAIKETFDDKQKSVYYIENGEYLFMIEIDSGDDEKSLVDQNVFFEMLNTFRLSDAEENLNIDSPFLDELISDEEIEPETDSDTDEEEVEPVDVPDLKPEVKDLSTEGFNNYESETFGFGFDYPGGWYFEGSSSSESGVLRHYSLGDQPLDEEDGFAAVDVISGSAPSGQKVVVNGVEMTKVTSNGSIELYVAGEGTRVYRVSGPSTQESSLLKVASTVEEL
ncbi:hypothetical protein ACFL2V_03030 [Pseudomonadota bacterium]